MPVDPSYSVRLGWFATDLDPDGHIDAAQVPYDNTTSGLTATDAQAAIDEVAGAPSAPTSADYLVGTAQAGLSAEIVVGTTPGGELGGTWASPTVDSSHSGSTHAATQAAAEATAATALSGHVADITSAHSAAGVDITDTGSYYTSSTVEGALQEIGAGGIGGGGSAITVQDEGSSLATAATTVNFVGAGVTASGTGATKTITVPGGSGATATDAAAWMPLTSVVGGVPELVWDADDSLVPTFVPL